MPRSGNMQPAIDNSEHIGPNDTGDNIEAKRVANYVWNSDTLTWERQTASASSGGDGHTILAGTEVNQKDDANYGEGITSGVATVHPRVWNGTNYDRWIGMSKPTDKYAVSNIDSTGSTYKYFGFEDKDGNWYIMRKTIATNAFDYTKGPSAYATGWTNRASQTYASYSVTF